MFLSDFYGLKEIGIDNLEKIFVHTDENVYTDRLNEKKILLKLKEGGVILLEQGIVGG